MSNFAFGLLTFAWFAAGIGIVLLIRSGIKSLREWASIQRTAYKAHRLNKRRESLVASAARHGRCMDWDTACRIYK